MVYLCLAQTDLYLQTKKILFKFCDTDFGFLINYIFISQIVFISAIAINKAKHVSDTAILNYDYILTYIHTYTYTYNTLTCMYIHKLIIQCYLLHRRSVYAEIYRLPTHITDL